MVNVNYMVKIIYIF